MQQLSFETLILPADFYSDLLLFCIRVCFIICVAMIIVSFIINRMGLDRKIPLMWYVYAMKMAISGIIAFLVFFYDYKTKTVKLTDFQNMYVSTYLVGLLAVVEILTCVASMIDDLCNMSRENMS